MQIVPPEFLFLSYLESNQPMGRIEEFTEKEKQKASWLEKLAANFPTVTATSLLGRDHPLPINTPGKIIRPSLVKRGLYLFAFLMAFSGWLYLVIPGREKGIPLAVYLIFIPFLLFMSVSFLLVPFLKRYNYRIRIDGSEITLREDSISWSEIIETAVMRQPAPRGDRRYLVIFKRDGTELKSDLFLFGISDRKLASVIEHYKALASPSGAGA
jgi:hypothetical protein